MPSQLTEKFRRAGLELTSRRNVTLFTSVCVGRGYAQVMKKLFGFSYEQLGVFFAQGEASFFMNKEQFSVVLEQWLEKHSIEDDFLKPAWKNHESFKKQITLAKTKKPAEGLQLIQMEYITHLGFLGMINGMMRYIGDQTERGRLTKATVEKLAQERDQMTRLYTEVDALIQEWITGTRARNCGTMTPEELEHFFERNEIDGDEMRRKWNGCIYLNVNGKEEMTSDGDAVIAFREAFLNTSVLEQVHGTPVYKGVVKGTVVTSSDKLRGGEILVTSMTHPKDVIFLKKCAAIVTDEGGILSHAAIMARELGKPCVIGTQVATKVFKDGDCIEVDADKGIVRKVE